MMDLCKHIIFVKCNEVENKNKIPSTSYLQTIFIAQLNINNFSFGATNH